MPRDARTVAKSLKGKGFRDRHNDHTFFHLWVDDKKTPIFTKISHGEKEIGNPLLSTMARQLRLSSRQFDSLLDCPLSQEEYVEILRENGHIS